MPLRHLPQLAGARRGLSRWGWQARKTKPREAETRQARRKDTFLLFWRFSMGSTSVRAIRRKAHHSIAQSRKAHRARLASTGQEDEPK